MKFFVAFALIAAVASASYIKPVALSEEQAQIQEIIAAIQSPSTNPATAAALEEMLADILGLEPAPVAVGPAIIDQGPISVGPAIIDQTPIVGPAIVDFPIPDASEVSPVVVPEPVAVAPAATNAPLVQIILNINQEAAESSPVAVAPVVVPEPAFVVDPVNIVDNWPVVSPVSPVVVDPVQVVDVTPVVDPVQVADIAPVVVAPVIIGTPVLPSPAVVLPEQLN